MSFRLFDSHSHPQFAAYDVDRDLVIRRMKKENVATIAVGTAYETSKKAIALATRYPGFIFASAGIHPHHAAAPPKDPMEMESASGFEVLDERFRELAKDPAVVAIGECGFDYHYDQSPETKKRQAENFQKHLELALELRKPVIVHARDAYDDTYALLEEYKGKLVGAMHFFQGSVEDAKKFLRLGCYISFAGPITFSAMYDEVVRFVPLEKLLIETDAPYASPAPFRGKRNEPLYVRYVAEKIAELKNIPSEEVIRVTTENARTLFQLD